MSHCRPTAVRGVLLGWQAGGESVKSRRAGLTIEVRFGGRYAIVSGEVKRLGTAAPPPLICTKAGATRGPPKSGSGTRKAMSRYH